MRFEEQVSVGSQIGIYSTSADAIINVIGMNLIEDHHAAGEPGEAEHNLSLVTSAP
jgi:hypothetical protein